MTAELILGCTQSTGASGFEVGNEARLVVEDQDGTTIGTGTFQVSPGADSCDWTAEVPDVPADADFYSLDAGGPLAQMSRAELEEREWQVEAHIDVTGRVMLL